MAENNILLLIMIIEYSMWVVSKYGPGIGIFKILPLKMEKLDVP